MSKGFSLLVRRRYTEALEQLAHEIPRDWQDDYKVGPIRVFGVALLFLGRYRQAEKHFAKLIADRPAGVRVGVHTVGSGMALWFQGRHSDAVARWREGLHGHRVGYEGMEFPFMLFFAGIRDSDATVLNEAVELIQSRSKRVYPESTIAAICNLVLERKTFDAVQVDLRTFLQGSKFQKQLLKEDSAVAGFYQGLLALRAGNELEFYERMYATATVRGFENLYHEFILADYELKHGPRAWRKKYKEWLATIGAGGAGEKC